MDFIFNNVREISQSRATQGSGGNVMIRPSVRNAGLAGLWPARALLLSVALPALGLAAPFASAADEAVDAAEALVRATWFEGLPFAEASEIGAAGAARLRELLADPASARSHANALLALGISAEPGAYAALARYGHARERSSAPASSEIRRAWRVLPLAMGHLARRDPRALAWLVAERERAVAAQDTPRHEHILLALGVAGTPEADAILARVSDAAPGPLQPSVRRARELCARIVRDGARQTFVASEVAR